MDFQDSPGLKFADGNRWKTIGTWTSTTKSPGSVAGARELTVWLGLTGNDDPGAPFDLRAELLKNGLPIASGEIHCILDVPPKRSDALKVSVPFVAGAPSTQLGRKDALALRVSARIGTDDNGDFCGGRTKSEGLRLDSDSGDRQSQVTILSD